MNYIQLLLEFCNGRVLSASKNPWIRNPEYQEKIKWLAENGFVEKIESKRTHEIKYLVITDEGLAFLRDQNIKGD